MIEMRRRQLSFGDGLIAEEVSDLRESWMTHADAVLADEDIVAAVYEALAKRHPKSRCRDRRGAPAEIVLRLLVLKRIRNWSYEVLEREVRANLVYRDFTHVGGGRRGSRRDRARSDHRSFRTTATHVMSSDWGAPLANSATRLVTCSSTLRAG